MGADTPAPVGSAEAKAFNVFMKKYLKNHLHEDEDEWNWNGINAWGKLTTAQKKLFAMKPRQVSVPKRRASIQKMKRTAKPRAKAKTKAVGRPVGSRGKRLSKKISQRAIKKTRKE